MRDRQLNRVIVATAEGFTPSRADAVALCFEVKRLRAEVRRLRSWVKRWQAYQRGYPAPNVLTWQIDDAEFDDALAGKAPRKGRGK